MAQFVRQDDLIADLIKYPVGFSTGRVSIPTSESVVEVVGTVDAKIRQITLTNTTDTTINVTIRDGENVPLVPGTPLEPRGIFVASWPDGEPMPGGVYWSASAVGVLGNIAGNKGY